MSLIVGVQGVRACDPILSGSDLMIINLNQLPLDLGTEPVLDLRELESDANYGEVFTRRWVVEMILDLCGYIPDRDLVDMVLVYPACGDGAFVLPVLDRLIESCKRAGRPMSDLVDAVRAFDLQARHVDALRAKVAETLRAGGVVEEADRIAEDTRRYAGAHPDCAGPGACRRLRRLGSSTVVTRSDHRQG